MNGSGIGKASGFLWMIMGVALSLEAQVYRPIANNNMWDSYLFRQGDQYHLFYLQNENYPRVETDRPSWLLSSVGRAVSTDLVTWKTLPPINFRSYVNRHTDQQRMFIGQATARVNDEYRFFFDPRPRSFGAGSPTEMLTSRDLIHWNQKQPGSVLEVTAPHYGGGSWRDLFLSHDQGQSLWHGYLCAETRKRDKLPPPLSDMTVAVWLKSPAAQRNGGVFSIQFADSGTASFETLYIDHQRRWAVVSDQHRQRVTTRPVQETAGIDQPVMIALVYRQGTLRVYRNGLFYAEYQGEPRRSLDILRITMGQIIWPEGTDSINHFVGSIDEMRLYEQPLSAHQVAALRPGRIEMPEPMAAWTFEDTTADDVMGTFVMPELNLGARIEDGQLQLDGRFAHLYQTAISTQGMACIAHVTSDDLVQWEYRRPVYANRRFCNMECPDYFQMGDWHYFLFSTVRTRMDTGGRKDASGTYYIMSRDRDGPYHLPEKPLLFGSGRGRMDNYVGRSIAFGDIRLLYYHTVYGNIASCIREPVTWGAPKRMVQHPDGTLSLRYWDGLEKLHEARIYPVEDPKQTAAQLPSQGPGKWQTGNRQIAGLAEKGEASILWLPVEAGDVTVTGQLNIERGIGGIVWRFAEGAGRSVLLDPVEKVCSIESVQIRQAGSIHTSRVDDFADLKKGGQYDLRIMLRSHRVDIYIDEKWIFSTSVIDAPQNGKLGLYVADGRTRFTNLELTRVKPLEIPQLP